MNGFCTCRDTDCVNCGPREKKLDERNKKAREKRKAVNKLKLSAEEIKAVRQWAISNFNEYEEFRQIDLDKYDLNGAEDKARELMFKMYETGIDQYDAIQCAIVLAKEMIKETGKKFWYDVKRELETYYDNKTP
jgi:hypothetical protein